MPLEWGVVCSGAGPREDVLVREAGTEAGAEEVQSLGFRRDLGRDGLGADGLGMWPRPCVVSPDGPEPDLPPLCLQQINQDLNIQLLKDGYRLDEIPDDEDLDLIPPKSVNPTCMCCQATSSTACHIQ